MSNRYPFIGKLTKATVTPDGGTSTPNLDENGDPIPPSGGTGAGTGSAETIEFECDYQPTVTTPLFSQSGSFFRVSYKLFVSKSSKMFNSKNEEIHFAMGDGIECNGVSGEIVTIYPTKLNTEIWVK